MNFQVEVPIEKKPYMAASMYYLKRYIGVREIVLFTLLFLLGLGLFFWTQAIWAIVLAGVTVFIVAAVVVFYWATALAGYRMEFEKRGATHWQMRFTEKEFLVETHEAGDKVYPEKRAILSFDRVAIKKDRVYLYFSGAIMYYIPYNAKFTEGNFVEFTEWIRQVMPPEKFKMRSRKRNFKQYPYSRA